MNDNQNIKSDKYLNLPILTPEEEAAIEEREQKLAETRFTANTAEVSSAVLGDRNHTGESSKLPPDSEPLFTEVFTPEELKEQLTKMDSESISSLVSATELFETCVLPSHTELQEHNLKTKSDILIGDHCTIEFGLCGTDIAICECSEIHGDIIAEGDLRIDNFCEIFGTVICNGDAFIGESVKIHGKLTVGGNLDISDSATIEQEYRTFGAITIRNPIPVIVYILIYILAMLHIKGEKATEKQLNAFISEVQSVPLVLPPNTVMNLYHFSVQTPMDIGANCRIHGNVQAKSVKIKKDTTLFGSIRADARVKIGVRNAIHGDITAKSIRIERGADILGNITGETVWMHEDAHVSGMIKASDGLSLGFGG